jgi:transposase-like protein
MPNRPLDRRSIGTSDAIAAAVTPPSSSNLRNEKETPTTFSTNTSGSSLLPSALGIPTASEVTLDTVYTTADLFRDFPDDDVCLEYIKEQIWPKGLALCPKCGVQRKHYRVTGRKAYACNHCGHHIYPLASTIFSKSTTPLRTWFYMVYLVLSTGGMVSARQIQRETGVTYKTAWRSRAQIFALLSMESSPLGKLSAAMEKVLPQNEDSRKDQEN